MLNSLKSVERSVITDEIQMVWKKHGNSFSLINQCIIAECIEMITELQGQTELQLMIGFVFWVTIFIVWGPFCPFVDPLTPKSD